MLAHPVSHATHPRDPRAERPCVRPGCTRRATSTLRFDYVGRILMLDPLGPEAVPGEYDLCLHHAARSTPPTGWTLRDRAPSRESASESQPPVGPDRGHDVARLAAALSAVERAVSEDAPDAAPVGTDRSVASPRPATVPLRPRGSSRLDSLLQPSATEDVGMAEAMEEVEVRRAPQPLRLAPDPTTTVWCADLISGASTASPTAVPTAVPTAPDVRVTAPGPHWAADRHAGPRPSPSGSAPTLFG